MRKSKAAGLAAGATAAAVQPGGLRKVAAGCLLIALIGVLVLGGGLAALAWWANRPPVGLSCPATGPVRLQVAQTTPEAPKSAERAITAALEDAGRKVKAIGAGEADVRVVWVPSAPLTVSRTESPIVITVGGKVTTAEVKSALTQKGHLPSCSVTPNPAPAPAAPGPGWRWPWQGEATLAAVALLTLAAWWAVGPEAAHQVGKGLRALGGGLAVIARPVAERLHRAVRWVLEIDQRRDRRWEERQAALVAAQIAASAARQAALDAEEEQRRVREEAEFERVWAQFERARIEREEEDAK